MSKNSKSSDFLRNLGQKKLCKAFVNCFRIVESYKPNSRPILYICLSFYFFQIGSYFSEAYIKNINDPLAKFIFRIYYYSNFVNFFHLEHLVKVKIIIFAFFFAINIIILLFLLLEVFLPKKFKKRFLKNQGFNERISILCFVYDWILFIPLSETFLNLFDCGVYPSEFCSNENMLFLIISIVNFTLTIFLCVFFNYFNREYLFLDLTTLKQQSNLSNIMILISRISLVFFKKIIYNSEWIFLGLPFLFCFFSFTFYVEVFPIRNKEANKFYMTNLLTLSFFIIVILFWRCGIILESDIFFIFIFSMIIAAKLSSKIYDHFYIQTLLIRKDANSKLFSLEELCKIYYYGDFRDQPTLYGYFAKHYKDCNDHKCKKLREEIAFYNKMNYSNEPFGLSRFVSLHLNAHLIDLRRKKKKSKEFLFEETFILKFLTLTIEYDMNVIQSHFEIQKIINETTKDFSLFFNVASLFLKDAIKKNIKLLMKKSVTLLSTEANNYANCNEFFQSMKIKKKLEAELILVIKEKIKFFESLNNGQNSFGHILSRSMSLKPKTDSFKRKVASLENFKSPYFRAIKLKLETIYQSILLNHIFEGKKLEQELFLIIEPNSGTKSLFNSEFNFIDKNFITLAANFSGYFGFIKESCFSKKFRNFFEIEHENYKQMKSIEMYMPEIIGKNHSTFVKYYINGSKGNSTTREKGIYSYALNGEGFIFPVKVMLGLNLDFENQFVMNAAIKKHGNQNDKIFLCNMNGNIMNTSKSLFLEFKKEYPFIDQKDLEFLNICSLMPTIFDFVREVSTKEKIGNDRAKKLKNLSSVFIFPSNFQSMIKLLKSQEQSKLEFKKFNSLSSSRTKQTLKSEMEKERARNSILKDNDYKGNSPIPIPMKKRIHATETKMSDYENLVGALAEDSNNKIANVNFNLFLSEYSYEKKKGKKLEFFSIHIFDLAHVEKNKTFMNEETGFIPDSFDHQNLKLPIENEPNIFSVFARDKALEPKENTMEKNHHFKYIKESTFARVNLQKTLDRSNIAMEVTIEKKSLLIFQIKKYKSNLLLIFIVILF